MRLTLLHASALAALASASVAQQFDYIPGGIPGSPVWSNGVELVDVDGDGDMDVLFANGSSYGSGGSQPQHLFLNNGSGILTAAHGQLNVSNFNAQLVIAEDFDGDGDPDLMYAAEGPFPGVNQFPRFLINDGTGVFTDESALRLPPIPMASFCVCAGDVDNDGDLDVVFTDGGTFGGVATQARLYLNDGDGFFTNATSTNVPSDTYNAQDVTLVDYDGDFDLDIALSGKGQNGKRSRLWLNDGTGNFTVSNALNNVGSGGTYEVDFADLDGDDDVDGLVQSISGFSEGWARNVGPLTAAVKTTFPSPNGDDDNEMAGMDYDNDGDIDVFVGSLGSSEKVYRNTGAVFAKDAGAIEAQGDSTLDIGFADLDGDGDYEMVSAQGESGNYTNKLYRNTGSADNLAPVFVRAEVPTALTEPETSFRVQVRDQVHDDGHISATMAFSYTTVDGSGGTSGGGEAMHQGSGQFRAAVPTGADTTEITLTWTATDSAGNVSVSDPVVAPGSGPPPPPGCGFVAYGENLGGANIVTLSSPTTPTIGATVQFDATGYNGGGVALFVLSAGQAAIPFGVGTILISLNQQVIQTTIPIGPAGDGGGFLTIPNNPNLIGYVGYFQTAMPDASFAGGYALSNGLEVTVCGP